MADLPGGRRLGLILLGGFAVTLDGEPVVGFDSNKVRALLAYLAVEVDRVHRRESLAALLWPGYPERSARTNLRNALANLRTVIGDRDAEHPFLVVTRETVQVNAAGDCLSDVRTLGSAYASADELSTEQLADAADLYIGDLLAGFSLADAVGFDDWAAAARERVRVQAQELLGEVVGRLEADGDPERTVVYARRRVELAPWREDAQRELIQLLAETGQRSAALRQYRACVRALEEELGAEPSRETVSLYDHIRAGTRGEDGVTVSGRPSAALQADHHLPAFLVEGAEPPVGEQPVFVGREPELARLDAYLDAALAGQGQVAFVVGGPGRGKTALLRAFAERAMAAHPELLVVRGACNAYSGVGDAYLPFSEALAMLTGDVEPRWRAGRISRDHAQRLWSGLAAILPALVAHGPYVIGSFVSGADAVIRAEQAGLGDAKWMPELLALSSRSAVSGLEQKPLFQQVTNTLQAVSTVHPLALVLDDLQWADQGSVGLLFHLGRRLAGHRILIVGTYRPEEVAGKTFGPATQPDPLANVLAEFRRQFGDVRIDLRQADVTEGRAFVDALVDAEENRLSESFRHALFARTGGHPLFTVELLRHLRAGGDLVQDVDGAWVERAEVDWSPLPARVEAVIAARLDRLAAAHRDLLAVASVEGETFTVEAISRVQGLSKREVLRTLSRDLAARRHLVREVEGTSEADSHLSRFAFIHALYQEHLYRELSGGEQRLLHGEVAAALEDLHGESVDVISVQLAYHYDKAGNSEKTVEYAARAGERARLAYAGDEANRHYELALSRCRTAKTSAAIESWQLMALSGLGKLSYRNGDVSRAEGYFRDAIALGHETGLEPQTLVLFYHWLGEALFHQSRYEERCRVGEEGLQLVAGDPRSLGAALMNQTVAMGATGCGDWARGEALTLQTAEFIRDLPYVDELELAYGHIAVVCFRNKDIQGYSEWTAALEALAIHHGELAGLAAAYERAANLLEETGDPHPAFEKRQRGLETIVRTGDTEREGSAWFHLAEWYWYMGDLAHAAECAEKALELDRTTGLKRSFALSLCLVGRVALGQGAWSTAVRYFGDALPLLEAVKYRTRMARAQHHLGRAHLGAEHRDQAQRCLSEGIRSLPEPPFRTPFFLAESLSRLLSGLEEAYSDPAAYRAWCERFRAERPSVVEWAPQLCLAPVGGRAILGSIPFAGDSADPSPGWLWIDPYGDCGFQTVRGLEITAANVRDLWYMNLSAPRLVRDMPSGADRWGVQVDVEQASADRPAIGGLLLWRNKQNYARLDLGRFGKRDIAFGGCLDNTDVIIGRGRLPGQPGAGWEMGIR